jgi:hypothetical protein
MSCKALWVGVFCFISTQAFGYAFEHGVGAVYSPALLALRSSASSTTEQRFLALGFQGFYQLRFLPTLTATLGYDIKGSRKATLLQGPVTKLGWTILGGRTRVAHSIDFSLEHQYFYDLQVHAGPWFRFRNLAPLLPDNAAFLSDSAPLAKKGTLIGLAAGLDFSFPIGSQFEIKIQTELSKSLAEDAPNYSFESLNFGLGVAKWL